MGQVWGGIRAYGPWDRIKVFEALADFVENNHKDPKAAVIFMSGMGTTQLAMVYDGPVPPKGAFGKFETLTPMMDLARTMAYTDLVGITDSLFNYFSMRTSFRVSLE